MNRITTTLGFIILGHLLAAAPAPVGIQLNVVYADSEETGTLNAHEAGWAQNAVDGRPQTVWQTQWQSAAPAYPHEIIIELTPPSTIQGLTYLPRQDALDHGVIRDYEVYLSDDLTDFGPPVVKDTFARNKAMKKVEFAPRKCRYVKLRALSEIKGRPWASAAEINVIPVRESPPPVPVVAAADPANAATTAANTTAANTNTTVNPITNTITANPTNNALDTQALAIASLTNTSAPNTHTAATDAVASDPPPPTTPPATATNQIKLTVTQVDSEEPLPSDEGQDGRAGNAVDGNPQTLWHTQWQNTTPDYPHFIILRLSEPALVKGVTYLPRQDRANYGNIRDYEIYLSEDGQNFGLPVAKDAFTPGSSLKTVTFPPQHCRYLKLRALSEVNGGPSAAAAEISIIQ